MKLYLLIGLRLILSCNNSPKIDLEKEAKRIDSLATPYSIEAIMTKSRNETVFIMASFLTPDDQYDTQKGCGFIIGGKYLVSCYHVFVNKKYNRPPARIDVFKRAGDINDTLTAIFDPSFKYGKFELAKHKYIKEDESTDFIILPLTRQVHFSKIGFDSTETPNNTLFYSSGPIIDSNNQFIQNGNTIPLVQKLIFDNEYGHFLALIGNATPGFSGSPIFSKNGEIAGIVQGTITSTPEEYFSKWVKSGELSQKIVDDLSEEYKKGKSIAFCFRMNDIIRKYLAPN